MRHVAKITDGPEPRGARLQVSGHERLLLLRWSRSRTLAARVVVRSRMILMLAEDSRVASVAEALRVSPSTVRLWRDRFLEHGPRGLFEEMPGRGRKPALDLVTRQALRAGTDVSHASSLRRQARELGVSASTVSRWRRRWE